MKDADAPRHPPEKVVPGAAYRSLLQIAVLGSELAEYAAAAEIADALKALRPDLPQAAIVLAMNEFSAGRVDRGIADLEIVLDEFPDSQLARAMLAVCLKISERSGWQALFEAVIDDGRDEFAIGLACSFLGRADPTAAPGQPPVDALPPAHVMWA